MENYIYTGNRQSGDLQVIGLKNGTVSLLDWLNENGWHGRAFLPSPDGYPNPSFSCVRIGNHRGTLEVVGMGADNNLYVICYLDGDGWHSGSRIGSFGGSSITSPCIGNSHQGDMEIIALKDGRVQLLNWLTDGGWNTETPLPVPDGNLRFDQLALGFFDDTLEVIGLTGGNALYVASYLTKTAGWKAGSRLSDLPSGSVTSIVTGNTHSGDLQVIGLVDGRPYILAWIGKNIGWQGPTPLPKPEGYAGTFRQLAISRYRDTLEIMGIGSDNNVYIVCYIASEGGWQSGRRAPSAAVDGTITSVVTGTAHSGDLQVLGLVDGSPWLLTWLGGEGWQSGRTLAFGAVEASFLDLPPSGREVIEFKHSDAQPEAHIQGMSLWQDYTIFSHNRTNAYGYLLFGDHQGKMQTIDVAVNGAGGNGDDHKYYHPSGLQVFEDYLVLGVEPSEPNNEYGKVIFYRISQEPEAVRLTTLDTPSFQRTGRGAACCGLTRASGTYVLAIFSTRSETVDIYTSGADRLEDASFGDIRFSIAPSSGYDNLSMASTPDGGLYLFGLRSESQGVTFADYVDLYEIDLGKGTATRLETRKFDCKSVGGAIGVHFRYGAGVTVAAGAQAGSVDMRMYASARHFELTGTPLNFFEGQHSGGQRFADQPIGSPGWARRAFKATGLPFV